MKKNNFLLRIASVLLAVLLLLPMGLTAWAAEAKTVRIATVEDLVELAERCSSDSYSKGDIINNICNGIIVEFSALHML